MSSTKSVTSGTQLNLLEPLETDIPPLLLDFGCFVQFFTHPSPVEPDLPKQPLKSVQLEMPLDNPMGS